MYVLKYIQFVKVICNHLETGNRMYNFQTIEEIACRTKKKIHSYKTQKWDERQQESMLKREGGAEINPDISVCTMG